MEHYELLGVRKSASAAEIRRAYQKLARRLHPDLNPGDPAAAERFGAVTLAYEVLSDPQRRAAYDRGERKAPAPPAVAAVGFEGFDFSVEVGGGSAFRELFESVLQRAPGADAARGEDLEARARLVFDEVMHGARRRIEPLGQTREACVNRLYAGRGKTSRIRPEQRAECERAAKPGFLRRLLRRRNLEPAPEL